MAGQVFYVTVWQVCWDTDVSQILFAVTSAKIGIVFLLPKSFFFISHGSTAIVLCALSGGICPNFCLWNLIYLGCGPQ